jgi:hypothetical protein
MYRMVNALALYVLVEVEATITIRSKFQYGLNI